MAPSAVACEGQGVGGLTREGGGGGVDGRNRMPVACRGWEDRRVGSRGDGDVTARPELGAWALTGVAGLAGGLLRPARRWPRPLWRCAAETPGASNPCVYEFCGLCVSACVYVACLPWPAPCSVLVCAWLWVPLSPRLSGEVGALGRGGRDGAPCSAGAGRAPPPCPFPHPLSPLFPPPSLTAADRAGTALTTVRPRMTAARRSVTSRFEGGTFCLVRAVYR